MLAEAVMFAVATLQIGSAAHQYAARFTCDILTTFPVGRGRAPTRLRTAPIQREPRRSRETITIMHWSPFEAAAAIRRTDSDGANPQSATLAAVEVDARGRFHLALRTYAGEVRLDENGDAHRSAALTGSYLIMDLGRAHMTGNCSSEFREQPRGASIVERNREQ